MERRKAIPRGASPAVAAGLGVVIVMVWSLVVWPVLNMQGALAKLMMPATTAWTPANVVVVFLMWAVMMAAMMLPGALPMVFLYERIVRRTEPLAAGGRTGIFVLAYLAIWAAFSLGATAVQWALQKAVLLSPMAVSTSPWLTAALLIAAGAYQFTPLKRACLTGCRPPLGFLMTEWRGGAHGALIMGLRHGTLCVGCCWALMALAFVGGTMNLVWMGALTVAVTLEKVVPKGAEFTKLIGVLLVGSGLVYGIALI